MRANWIPAEDWIAEIGGNGCIWIETGITTGLLFNTEASPEDRRKLGALDVVVAHARRPGWVNAALLRRCRDPKTLAADWPFIFTTADKIRSRAPKRREAFPAAAYRHALTQMTLPPVTD